VGWVPFAGGTPRQPWGRLTEFSSGWLSCDLTRTEKLTANVRRHCELEDCRAGTTVTHLTETVVPHRGEKTMANQHLAVEAPAPQNVTVRSRQPREYLTAREIERLIEAAPGNLI
jgi:hypothetical protein